MPALIGTYVLQGSLRLLKLEAQAGNSSVRQFSVTDRLLAYTGDGGICSRSDTVGLCMELAYHAIKLRTELRHHSRHILSQRLQ